jgi:polysaccharide biosynthesis protein PslG
MLFAGNRKDTVTVTSGRARKLYSHLFRRPDGKQVLFMYDKETSPTVRVTLQTPGSAAYRYALDGSISADAAFDGRTLSNVSLSAGTVAIFQIDP